MDQQRWAEVMRQALLASAGVVLLTAWWVSDAFVVEVMALVPVAAGIGWLLGVERLHQLWWRVGLVVIGALVAMLVAATGGSDSVYQDLFLVVIISAALVTEDPRGLLGGVAVAAVGAAAPALYEDVGRVFVADTVADLLVWAAAGAVTWRIERGRARQERDRVALLQRFVTVAEDERDALADDLHDEAIQLLAAARLRLRTAPTSAGGPELQAADDLLGDGLQSLRRLMLELKSPDVSTGSLEELLRAYAERLLEPSGIALDLRVALPADLHGEVVTAAYRIIVEALSNAARHSGASTVEVVAMVDDGALVGRVRDDGRGLAAERRPRPGHIGLRAMRDRAEVLGGSTQLRSRPGADGGTEVSFTLPLRPDRP